MVKINGKKIAEFGDTQEARVKAMKTRNSAPRQGDILNTIPDEWKDDPTVLIHDKERDFGSVKGWKAMLESLSGHFRYKYFTSDHIQEERRKMLNGWPSTEKLRGPSP